MKVLQTFALPLGYGTVIRNGAVDGARTRDLHLGKVALYQLSYYRTAIKREWKAINGAGDGNRTHVASLEGWNSTIELHPHNGASGRS